MTERKRKRKNKYRGNRTFGMGDTKNRRGSGVKGGKGKAGSKKHKFSKYYVFAGTLRKHKPKPKGKAVNLEFFDQKMDWLLEKKAVFEENGFFVVDGKKLDIQKVLGKGKPVKKMLFKNLEFSQKARQKIEQAGGKILQESLQEELEVKE